MAMPAVPQSVSVLRSVYLLIPRALHSVSEYTREWWHASAHTGSGPRRNARFYEGRGSMRLLSPRHSDRGCTQMYHLQLRGRWYHATSSYVVCLMCTHPCTWVGSTRHVSTLSLIVCSVASVDD